jgi:hypothetical protein
MVFGLMCLLWMAMGATGQLWLWHKWLERYPPADRRTVPWGDLAAVVLLGGLGGPLGLVPTIVDFAAPPRFKRRRRSRDLDEDEDVLF